MQFYLLFLALVAFLFSLPATALCNIDNLLESFYLVLSAGVIKMYLKFAFLSLSTGSVYSHIWLFSSLNTNYSVLSLLLFTSPQDL